MRWRHRYRYKSANFIVGESWSAPAGTEAWFLNYAHGPGWSGSLLNVLEESWDENHGKGPYNVGGPLNLWKYQIDPMMVYPCPELRITYGAWDYKYVGGFSTRWVPNDEMQLGVRFISEVFSPQWYYSQDPQPRSSDGAHTWGDVSSYGPTAWKKYRPGKSVADAGVFIGEIRDVPKMLRKSARYFRDLWVAKWGRTPRKKFRSAADQWLNTQFGWLPFLSDLRKFYQAYRDTERIIAQIRCDNGQWIKRGGTVDQQEESEVVLKETEAHMSHPALIPQFYAGPPSGSWYQLTKSSGQKVWFEGRFRYWIPDTTSVAWNARAIAEIYGIYPNPALLWELTPWSWLVDWGTNVGDVFSNLDTGLAENLAAKYAYVMGTKYTKYTLESKPCFATGYSPTHTWVYELTRKTRVQANPFGFGLTDLDLTARQWSILGALGITRSL